ncbi:MAG TPA: hypothetical protein VGK19_21605 [Capsulimonadaceae bacterium]|jgi:hypothetical protein
MSLRFLFEYLDDDKTRFPVAEVEASFQPIFDRVGEVLPEGWLNDAGLFPSFVEEYFEDKLRQAEEWDAQYGSLSVDELAVAFADGKLQWGEENVWTGPSIPFIPEELDGWAERWIAILPQMPESVRDALFAGEATSDRTLADLAHCQEMARCAKERNVLITMSTRT